MVEYKEIPIDGSKDQIDQDKEESSILPEEPTLEELHKRARDISSSIYKILGFIVLLLGTIIIPLVILSFFFNAGQPDKTLLLIEQIVGIILALLAYSVGIGFLVTAKKLRKKEILLIEQLSQENYNNTLK